MTFTTSADFVHANQSNHCTPTNIHVHTDADRTANRCSQPTDANNQCVQTAKRCITNKRWMKIANGRNLREIGNQRHSLPHPSEHFCSHLMS